ncbi:MAG TPA: TetR/AcrR family transcriptional regulator [Polyangiaceae bacterium]
MPRRAVKKRRTYHHGDLRRALLAASIALIAEKGADGFTLREAARLVGVSHAAAYRHFGDKKAVLEAIAAQGYRELADRLRGAIARVPRAKAELRLLRIGAAYVTFALEQEPRFRVMTRRRREEQGSPELEAAIDDAFGVLLGVARDGIESGALKRAAPIDHAMRVYLCAYGYANLILLGRVRVRPENLESYFTSLVAPLLTALRGD